MDSKTQARLLEINQVFYDRFSKSFSATRNQVQPGVRKVIKHITPNTSLLDVGCGNGTLARALASQGFSGTYLGVDMSSGLLSIARKLLEPHGTAEYYFRQVDLANPNWAESLSHKTFQWLVAFAVLHHLPGETLRRETLQNFKQLIMPGSQIAVSVWQWQNSARLRDRVLSWDSVGIHPEDVDEGDVLLDWRAGKTPGIRYVHTFTQASLTRLARKAGFQVAETFYSDGKSGDLALYQIWHA